MKRAIQLLLTVMCMGTLTACTGNDKEVEKNFSENYEISSYGADEKIDNTDDVKMSLKSIEDLHKATVEIENNSDKEYRYSESYFEIEGEEEDKWYQLEQYSEPSEDNEADSILKSGETKKIVIDIEKYYGKLPEGHYRIINQFSYFENPKDWDYDVYNISCEFDVK